MAEIKGIPKYYSEVTRDLFKSSKVSFRIVNDNEITEHIKRYPTEISFNREKVGKKTRIGEKQYIITDIFEEQDSLVMILKDPENIDEAEMSKLFPKKKSVESEEAENAGKIEATERTDFTDFKTNKIFTDEFKDEMEIEEDVENTRVENTWEED